MNNPFHILESFTLLAVMFTAELLTIAQAATPNLESVIGPLLQSFGIPGAWLAVVAYTLRKVILMAAPHAEAIVKAYIARQESMAACQLKLTDSTTEIQQKNLDKLTAIEKAIPGFCHAKPPGKSTPPES